MLVLEDCFAYEKYGKCKALKKMECANCKFYQNRNEYLKDVIRCEELNKKKRF